MSIWDTCEAVERIPGKVSELGSSAGLAYHWHIYSRILHRARPSRTS